MLRELEASLCQREEPTHLSARRRGGQGEWAERGEDGGEALAFMLS